jgi:Nucleoside-diphosphate-sugar epimerases
MRVLIIGAGYIGLPLGEKLAQQGHSVYGLRRTTKFDSEMRSVGVRPLHADISKAETLSSIPPEFDWIVNCAGSSGSTAQDYLHTYFEGTKNILDWFSNRLPSKYVYTSSTSVYDQNDGSWVTEQSSAFPRSETAAVLMKTERLLMERAGLRSVILRLAGIYGPGRGYWLRQFLNDEARMEGNGERFLNMIHQEDAVDAIIATLRHRNPGPIYNVVDTEPVMQRTMFEWLSQELSQPMPPASTEPTEPRRRPAHNRRISSARLRSELGIQFRYPTFREGFTAELKRLGVIE